MHQYTKTINGWIETEHGSRYHYVDGKLHKEDGPAAILTNGTVIYYNRGKKHRNDGPAVIYKYGSGYYYYLGKKAPEGSVEYKMIKANEKERLRRETLCIEIKKP